MSILTVTSLAHGFGDGAIFTNVSFRMLKGEHIGLVGTHGEGKSTFMNIVTQKLHPDTEFADGTRSKNCPRRREWDWQNHVARRANEPSGRRCKG
ncbi:hypothetical protein AAC03nite_37440 [Alicyclobacillus acidoterrestris]|nr:hypothetical protein AAC03nite_37440 [Alicyclobacillus acidoterrestris]